MPAVGLLTYETCEVGQCRQEGDFEIGEAGETFEDRRQPERYAITSGQRAEVAQRQQHNVTVAQRLPDTERMDLLLGVLFLA